MSTGQRVLLIGPLPPPPTGQSIAFEMLVEGLAPEHATKIVNLAERHGRRDASFSPRRVVSVLRAAAQVWRQSADATVVYLQIAQSRWGFIRDLLFVLIARMRSLPIVAHLHGGGYGDFFGNQPAFMRWIIRSAVARFNRVIVLSDALRDNFRFMGEGYSARLRTVANACPVAGGQPRMAPRGGINLLYLSNLLMEKGYLDCVDAFVHIERLLPGVSVHLTLAGAPMLGADEYRSAEELVAVLNKHIRYFGISDRVRVVGVVAGEEKDRLLREAHIALLPTYYRNEGQPITVIEAMAIGLPQVTTDWRDIGKMIGSGESGIIVPPRSPLAIAEAVAQLYRDPELYERMSMHAIKRAQQFTREKHIAHMMDVFQEVQGEA